MRYAWTLLFVGWVVCFVALIVLVLVGLDIRNPFESLGDVL